MALEKKPKGILKKLNPSSNCKSEVDVKIALETENSMIVDIKTNINSTGLPVDFFDTASASSSVDSLEAESYYHNETPQINEMLKPSNNDILPEGFFDDPVADAKARNVEYRDKEADEWEAFLKEVSAAEIESRVIIAEDKEEAALEMQIEQADEQIACLERIVELDKKKSMQIHDRRDVSNREEDAESSDEDFVPVIWRTKNSLI